MWWQYIVTFVGSLIVALVAVWTAQCWSDKRSLRKALINLRGEVSTNLRVCKLICDGVKKDVELIEKEQIGLTPYPRFYSSVWTSVRQNISLGDHTLSESLEDAYIMLDVVNECLRRVEELKHGVSGALMNINKMRVATLTLAEGLVNTRAQPFLEKVKTLLDTRLKLQNSKPIERKEQ